MSDDLDAVRREFARYNGFYKRPEARQVIYELFRGQCAASGDAINLETADVGHIVPQSEAAYFEELFPGLDVHNLINLHLLHSSANRRVSNHFPRNPLFLHNAISYNIGLIRRRLPKIESAYAKGAIGFDPKEALDGLRLSVDVDYANVYDQAVCHGDFHVLDGNLVEEAYKKAIVAADVPWKDVVKDHGFYGLKTSAIVHVDVDHDLVTHVSSACLPEQEESRRWSYALHQRFLGAKLDHTPQDLPNGNHLFLPGAAQFASQRSTIQVQRHSFGLIEDALEFVIADRQEKHLMGKIEGKPLYFIEDARALERLYQAARFPRCRFGQQVEAVSFPEKVWFTHGHGSSFEYPDFAKAKLDWLGVGQEFGCLISKSDYNGYLRRIRKAAQSDVARFGTLNATVEMRTSALRPSVS